MDKKILLTGESWTTHVLEIKGCDYFSVGGYDEGKKYLFEALKGSYDIEYLPSQKVPAMFPEDLKSLRQYDTIILSDIGANSFLLNPKTFFQFQPTQNRLKLLASYVREGGALCMVGGYMSFMGIEGKAFYKGTEIEELLPVTLLERDDRVETPEGISITVDPASHPILAGMPEKWPILFGYNRLIPKKDAQVIVWHGDDPIIALGVYGKGRTVAYATDCAPHWAPPVFCEWEHYGRLWRNLVAWMLGDM